MAELENTFDEIAARLMLHEFLLEVSMANLLAGVPPEVSDQAKLDLIDRMGKPRPDSDEVFQNDPRAQAIARRALELADRFVEKLSEREMSIRNR